MKGKLIIILALLLINGVLASPDIQVNKYSTGFSLMPRALEQNVCSCGVINDEFIIQNSGSFEAIFSAQNNLGLYQNFESIKLKSGQQAVLKLSGNLACETGELNYLVRVSSDKGVAREVTRSGEINKCQNLQLTVNDTEEILPGTTYTKTVQIINTGSFSETYVLKSKSLNEYLENTTFNIILDPYTNTHVDFVYNFPPEVYGEKTFKFEAEAITNDLKARIEDDFLIVNAYEFSVQADEQTICTEINNPFKIYIKNDGLVDNNFNIQVLSGRNYELSENTLFVESEKTGELTIIPNKQKAVEEKLRLKITQEFGDNNAIIEIPVIAKNCYDLYVEIPQEISHCGGEKDYNILVKNTGELYQDIQINTESGEISDESFSLDAGEEKNLEFTVAYPETTSIEIGSALGFKTYNIPTRTAEYCTTPLVLKENFVVRNEYAQLVIPIKNIGFADGNFELSVDNDAELSTEELLIPAGQTRNLLLSIDLSGRDFGNYAFNLEVEGETSQEVTISVDYQDKTLIQKGINYLNNNPCLYVLGGISVIAFILLLLWIFAKPKEKGNLKVTAIIVIIILLVSLVLILTFKGLPEPIRPALNSEPLDLYYETYTDQVLNINLNQYFEDEDSDSLSYELYGDDINFEIDNGILSIKDVPGTYEISFEAFDGEDYTESPTTVIVIKEIPQMTIFSLLERYCSWLSWLILLLACIFLLGLVTKLSGPKEKGTFEKPKFKEKPAKKGAKKSAKKKAVKKKTAKKTMKKAVKKTSSKKEKPEEEKTSE